MLPQQFTIMSSMGPKGHLRIDIAVAGETCNFVSTVKPVVRDRPVIGFTVLVRGSVTKIEPECESTK